MLAINALSPRVTWPREATWRRGLVTQPTIADSNQHSTAFDIVCAAMFCKNGCVGITSDDPRHAAFHRDGVHPKRSAAVSSVDTSERALGVMPSDVPNASADHARVILRLTSSHKNRRCTSRHKDGV